MKTHLPTITAAALVLLAGAVYGRWTDRWTYSTELRDAVEDLTKLPMNIDEWEGRAVELDEDQRETMIRAEIAASVVRRYVHRETGEEVSLFAVCGRPGPISSHSPEACYTGRGLKIAGKLDDKVFSTGAGTATFKVGDFRQPDAIIPGGLKIYWTWRVGRAWEAPDDPRSAFAGYRALYKVYVIRHMAMPGRSPVKDGVTPRFIQALLPEFEKILGPGSGPDDPRARHPAPRTLDRQT